MIYKSNNNPNSHLTVKERVKPSLPAKVLLERKLINGSVLDFGCGHGTDISFLQKKGFSVTGFDPHYKPNYPEVKFDTITLQLCVKHFITRRTITCFNGYFRITKAWWESLFFCQT